MASISEGVKPHALLIPYPAQGHVNPMFKLAKLLHFKGFHITFVNTVFNHKRLIKSRGLNALDGLPDFQFKTIPDGLPPTDLDATQDTPSLCDSTRKNCLVPLLNLTAKLNHSASSGLNPPVSCIVADGGMTFPVKATEELGIPILIFWTASACGLMCYAHIRSLIDRGLIPLKDESCLTNGYLDNEVDWIPGIRNIRLRDFPSFIRTTDPNDIMIDYAIGEVDNILKASAIIINTFDELEDDVLNALASIFPPIYTIGPLHLLDNQIPDKNLVSIGSNLWKEDTNCLQWLDSKEPRSVVYVNYGSITVMTPDQFLEFAWGLANSKKPFLWIIRPDLVNGGSVILSSEFVNETKDRGLIASWCPQVQVLSHQSIGGFLTHCGWNSVMESVSWGIPMICWPFFAEQQTNCRFVCTEWGIGMEIDTNVKRDEVEKLVNELMEGEKGKEMNQKVMKWKKKAEEAIAPNGLSCMNLDKLVNEVFLK
ncbi:Glycosyltransferase [Quillaja saponaria]|uniref:Glycosyltransferase n=1 Tax=Quillaja saponaria TaxID=32244 RepID=A0AAD7KVT3_QUISA|nr:Glycosyltransferase [Quillaja saponaria]